MVGANAYKLELPRDMAVSTTFNVGDLSPYVKDDIDFGDLRENPFEGGEDDAGQAPVPGLQTEPERNVFLGQLQDQLCKGKQCSFEACLGRSLLCWVPYNPLTSNQVILRLNGSLSQF